LNYTLSFLCSNSGVQCQIQFIQSGPEIKRPGESIKLTCKASGYTFTSYTMSWIRQAPGKGLEWVGNIWTNNFKTFYAKTLEGRVTITVETSINTTYLQLVNLKAEDTAVYYCARYTVRNKTCTAVSNSSRELLLLCLLANNS
uniref:Ig-like domain-containing protein n=1 Tax=Salvator merianae TaxID=96440 RepID=A0A8D0BCH2_SALMN